MKYGNIAGQLRRTLLREIGEVVRMDLLLKLYSQLQILR
jgi:hypothetical protein